MNLHVGINVMNNLSIKEVLPVIYTFYNKRLCDLDDDGVKTPEQKYFAEQTTQFYNKNYIKWKDCMEFIAKETNTIFWDTTFFNRQSFSCYFIFKNKDKVLVMMSRIYNIYYIDNESNIESNLITLLKKEMDKIYPSYFIASESNLMISLKPYFECFLNVDFLEFNIYNALLGFKPTL